jgi:hypothetical protein
MTTPASSSDSVSESTIQKERRLFREYIRRLRDSILNRLFDLRPEKAAGRRWYLIFLLLACGFLLTLRNYPLGLWVGYIQDIFSFLLRTDYVPNHAGEPFTNFVLIGFQALTDPRTLLYLPLFLLSFFIAYQAAAFYLADIFELDDVGVARNFVSEVALSGSDEAIRITQGDILDKHRSSPNFLIGGPGKVIVDIDSVALFEKPDGTPHVIGPTGREPGGRATLEGFERFRVAIDLRDHYIELRDQDNRSSSVKSRSRDGIPITATDVRFMFSVYRDNKEPTSELPYPFSKKAIEDMVYKATSRVTPNLNNPSTFEFSWTNNMFSLVRGELSKFMNEHNLTSYLASTGTPEFEKITQEENDIADKAKSLASSGNNDPPKEREIKPPPEFLSRHKIKSLFAQFTDEFTKKARDRGVELHWIGVGTWKTHIEDVSKKHLEAWTISRGNMGNGSKQALEALEHDTTVEELTTLLRDIPIGAYYSATEEYDEHDKALCDMLKSYQQQLIKARDFIEAKAKISPEDKASAEVIRKAIDNIIKSSSHGVY